MSISSEITRLQGVKADILTAIGNKGVVVPAGSALDDCPELIGSISSGMEPNTQYITVGGAQYGYACVKFSTGDLAGKSFLITTRNLNLDVGNNILTPGQEYKGRYYLPAAKNDINSYLQNSEPTLYADGWRATDFYLLSWLFSNSQLIGFNTFADQLKAFKGLRNGWESVANNTGETNATGLSIYPFGGRFGGDSGWHDGEQSCFWGDGYCFYVTGDNVGLENFGMSTDYLWASFRLYREI